MLRPALAHDIEALAPDDDDDDEDEDEVAEEEVEMFDPGAGEQPAA